MNISFEKFRAFAVRYISHLLVKRRLRYHFSKLFYDYSDKKNKGFYAVVNYPNHSKIRVKTNEIIGWNIFFLREYETDINKLIEKYLSDGDVVIEAGANIGSESILIAKKIGEKGRLYAFEPFFRVYNELLFNININKIKNTVINNVALGNDEKEIDFYLMDDSIPNQGMSSKINKGHNQKITINQTSIDKYVEANKLDKLKLLKMDVQGGELDILTGAELTIQKYKPLIITEAATGWIDLFDLYSKIESFDYEIFLIGEDNKKVGIDNIISGDWLCLPR